MTTDPIADLLTRISNAVRAGHEKTSVPYSKLKTAIVDVLKKNNFISDSKIVKSGSYDEIEIMLNPEIDHISLKRISKPGRRIYIKSDEIKSILNGFGISIISTPKGIMTGDDARRNNVGGEIICEIW
jgi:small subunit ribosomal protein S8